MAEFHIKNIDELPKAAKWFIDQIGDNKIFAFYGDMGAGKTTFIKAICEQLEVEDIVNSPTFSIINEYKTPTASIFHFDFYRIKNLEEAMDIGYEDYFYSNNLCFIEWPEKIEVLLPENSSSVIITNNEDESRSIRIN